MAELRIVVVPVGRIDLAEVEAAASRVSKVLNKAVELREAAPLTRSSEDPARGQHRAGAMLAELRSALPGLKVAKLVGGAASGTPVPTSTPDASIFVTDVDLFTPSTDSVLMELDAAHRAGVVSVRRLKEAFYRRKADPPRQRSRLVKELLRAVGRLGGLPDCRDAGCAVSPSVALADIDHKGERFCGACWRRLTTGAFRL